MDEKKRQAYWRVKIQTGVQILLVSDSAFFGACLAEKLLKKKATVYYFNQDPTGAKKLAALKIFPHFHLLKDKLPLQLDYAFQISTGPLSQQKISPLQTLRLCLQYQAKFLFATPYPEIYPRSLFTAFTKTQKVDWRLVYFHFVYGASLAKTSLLELFFSQLRQGKLILTGSPQLKLYPLYLEDWVEGVLRAMFSQASNEKTYYLAGLEKIDLTELLLRTKRILAKDFKVVYLDKANLAKTWEVDSWLLEKVKKSWWQLVYQPKVSLEEGIRRTAEAIFKQRQGLDLILPQWLRRFKKPILKFKIRFKPLLGGLLLSLCFLIFVSSPLWLFALLNFLGFKEMQRVKILLKNNDWQSLSPIAEKANHHFLLSQKIFWQFNSLFSLLLGQKNQEVEEILGLLVNLSGILKDSQQLFLRAQTLNAIIFQNKIADPQTELKTLLVDLDDLERKLAFSQARLEKLSKSETHFLKIFQEEIPLLLEQLPAWRQKIIFGRKILSLIPEVLAFEGKKTYLLLLQNNMELRPTGGFIGSYAVAVFEKGKLLDFRVEDVYSADGQLKGHVEPPAPIKKYLDKENWFLRDANWSPDFPTSAQQTAWFLEKETGQAVDGVIGLNLNVVRDLLKVVGPVFLPDYQESINSENFFERTEYHAEINFFPGSTQKKNFLTTLTTFLFEKIKNLEPAKSLELFTYWQRQLASKDLMFYFYQPELQQRFQFLGWTGEIKSLSFNQKSQFQGPGLIDYLMLVDANLGINKANYFIKRDLNYEVTILKEGQVVGELTLVYINESPSEAWPGGTYKNYLRLYLPFDVEKITVKEQAQDQTTFEPLSENNLEREQSFGKSVFGFLVEVPAQERKKIKINFQRKEKLNLTANRLDYLCFWQKQSGTGPDPLSLKINYPAFLKPLKIMPQGMWEKQKVSFKEVFDQDKLFAVEFSH